VAPFDGADEAALLAMLPPIPAWWKPEAAPAPDQAEDEAAPNVRWQEDREWLDRYYCPPEQRNEKAHQLRRAATQLINLLKSYPMAVAHQRAPLPGGPAVTQAEAEKRGDPAPAGVHPAEAHAATTTVAASGENASLALMRVFTNGIADDRIGKATRLVADDKLTANEKLTKIDALIPFPATASAEQLGEMLRVTKQAVMKTDWWIQNRKGEKESEVGRRREGHQRRAKSREAHGQDDNV
jgi:hypothetical protein